MKALSLEQRLPEVALAPVCALVGSDESLRLRCLQALTAAAAPAEQPGSTVRRFEGLPTASAVFDELRTLPFLGLEGRRAVVVEQGWAFLRAYGEQVARYLENPPPTATLILSVVKPKGGKRRGSQTGGTGQEDAADEGAGVQEKADAAKRHYAAALKAIRKVGVEVKCEPPTWEQARRWARATAEQSGHKLTPRAARTLVEAVGPDLAALESELSKLAAYREPGGTIAERDVEEMVSAARSRTVFELGDAVASGDAEAALGLCRRLMLRGESPDALVALLAWQVRRFWEAKRLRAEGFGQKEIAAHFKIRSDFVAGKLVRLTDGLSTDWLAARIAVLADADVELKTTAIRSGEEDVWMESLMARLCGGRT